MASSRRPDRRLRRGRVAWPPPARATRRRGGPIPQPHGRGHGRDRRGARGGATAPPRRIVGPAGPRLPRPAWRAPPGLACVRGRGTRAPHARRVPRLASAGRPGSRSRSPAHQACRWPPASRCGRGSPPRPVARPPRAAASRKSAWPGHRVLPPWRGGRVPVLRRQTPRRGRADSWAADRSDLQPRPSRPRRRPPRPARACPAVVTAAASRPPAGRRGSRLRERRVELPVAR